MNLENFKKTIDELEKEKQINDKKIILYDERERMSRVNSLEDNTIATLCFSTFAYLLLFSISSILIKSMGITGFTNIIPALNFPIIISSSSLILGILINNLNKKIYKTKERYKAFSNAKTNAEKIEEEVYYKIELEKIKNRNKTIYETIKLLKDNQNILDKLSIKYDFNDKFIPLTKEEAETKINTLSNKLKEEYDKLDTLTTKKIIHDNFWRTRSRFQTISDIIVFSTLIGILFLFFMTFPIMMLNQVIQYSSLFTALATTLAPLAVGIITTSGYMIKMNKDRKKAFDNLNSELRENALTERYEKFEGAYEEEQEIKSLLENQIKDISSLKVELYENKRHLDTFTTEEEKKEDVLFKNFPQLHITEETKRDVLEHPERYASCDVRTRMGMFYPDKEREKYIENSLSRPLPGGEEKGPTLVKRRKPTNPNDKK